MPSFFIFFFAKSTATSKGVWRLKAFHLARRSPAIMPLWQEVRVGSRWAPDGWQLDTTRRSSFAFGAEQFSAFWQRWEASHFLRRSWSSCEWFQLQCFGSARRERSEDLCAVCLSEQNKAKCFQLSVAWISPWEGRFQWSWECGNIEWDDAKNSWIWSSGLRLIVKWRNSADWNPNPNFKGWLFSHGKHMHACDTEECGHTYHALCVASAFQIQQLCPLCRTPVSDATCMEVVWNSEQKQQGVFDRYTMIYTHMLNISHAYSYAYYIQDIKDVFCRNPIVGFYSVMLRRFKLLFSNLYLLLSQRWSWYHKLTLLPDFLHTSATRRTRWLRCDWNIWNVTVGFFMNFGLVTMSKTAYRPFRPEVSSLVPGPMEHASLPSFSRSWLRSNVPWRPSWAWKRPSVPYDVLPSKVNVLGLLMGFFRWRVGAEDVKERLKSFIWKIGGYFLRCFSHWPLLGLIENRFPMTIGASLGGDDSKIPMIAAILQPGASSSGHPAQMKVVKIPLSKCLLSLECISWDPDSLKSSNDIEFSWVPFHPFFPTGDALSQEIEVRLAAVHALRALVPAFPSAWPGVLGWLKSVFVGVMELSPFLQSTTVHGIL